MKKLFAIATLEVLLLGGCTKENQKKTYTKTVSISDFASCNNPNRSTIILENGETSDFDVYVNGVLRTNLKAGVRIYLGPVDAPGTVDFKAVSEAGYTTFVATASYDGCKYLLFKF